MGGKSEANDQAKLSRIDLRCFGLVQDKIPLAVGSLFYSSPSTEDLLRCCTSFCASPHLVNVTLPSFEGVCLTPVILPPGAWQVGSDQHCLTPFPGQNRQNCGYAKTLQNIRKYNGFRTGPPLRACLGANSFWLYLMRRRGT